MQKHDALWKELLRTFFPEFLELALPSVAATLDCAARRFLEQESFTDHKDGRHVRLDVVAEVPTLRRSAQLVVIHIEVEREFGLAMDRRIFRYFAHLKLKLDRPVVPIVLYLRGGPAGIERRQHRDEVGDFLVHEFNYCAVGLSRARLDEFLSTSRLGPALASCTRGDDLPPHERKFRCMEAILDADVNPAQQMLLLNAVETYLELEADERLKYQRRVEESPKREEVLTMEMTWADRLKENGRREGVVVGRREGVAVARRLLLELTSSRFGTTPPALRARFEALTELGDIAAWSEKVAAARTPADLDVDD
ncbi:MAG: hypothetical protein AAFX50_15235 [Acidobacteriota bacterium]